MVENNLVNKLKKYESKISEQIDINRKIRDACDGGARLYCDGIKVGYFASLRYLHETFPDIFPELEE